MAKKLINRLTRTETQQNSKVEPDVLHEYSVGAFLTDEENRTLWVNGMPYGNAYISFNEEGEVNTRQPEHAEVFNDFDRNKAEGHYSHAEGGAKVNTVYNNAKITYLETPINGYKYSVPYTNVLFKMIQVMARKDMNIPLYVEINREDRRYNTDDTSNDVITNYTTENTPLAIDKYDNPEIDDYKGSDVKLENKVTSNEPIKYYIIAYKKVDKTIYFNVATSFDSATTAELPTYCNGKTMYFHYYYAYDGKDGWSEATKDGAHAEGISQARGIMSHSEGFANRSYEDYSHTEGVGNEVYGLAAHAEGDRNIVTNSAPYSHAEGHMNIAKADSVHVEGRNNLGNNTGAHVEGGNNVVHGKYGHAEGYGNTVNNDYGHAEGIGTIVTNIGEHAEGKYNVSREGYISSIGIGGDNNNRKNALTVLSDGRVYFTKIAEEVDNTVIEYDPFLYDGIRITEDSKSLQRILAETEQKLVEISYAELFERMESANLIPGQFYRIIDYVTTVRKNYFNISSASNPFDIVVLALSKDTLSENAYAIHKNTNAFGKNIDFEILSNTEITQKTNTDDKYEYKYNADKNIFEKITTSSEITNFSIPNENVITTNKKIIFYNNSTSHKICELNNTYDNILTISNNDNNFVYNYLALENTLNNIITISNAENLQYNKNVINSFLKLNGNIEYGELKYDSNTYIEQGLKGYYIYKLIDKNKAELGYLCIYSNSPHDRISSIFDYATFNRMLVNNNIVFSDGVDSTVKTMVLRYVKNNLDYLAKTLSKNTKESITNTFYTNSAKLETDTVDFTYNEGNDIYIRKFYKSGCNDIIYAKYNLIDKTLTYLLGNKNNDITTDELTNISELQSGENTYGNLLNSLKNGFYITTENTNDNITYVGNGYYLEYCAAYIIPNIQVTAEGSNNIDIILDGNFTYIFPNITEIINNEPKIISRNYIDSIRNYYSSTNGKKCNLPAWNLKYKIYNDTDYVINTVIPEYLTFNNYENNSATYLQNSISYYTKTKVNINHLTDNLSTDTSNWLINMVNVSASENTVTNILKTNYRWDQINISTNEIISLTNNYTPTENKSYVILTNLINPLSYNDTIFNAELFESDYMDIVNDSITETQFIAPNYNISDFNSCIISLNDMNTSNIYYGVTAKINNYDFAHCDEYGQELGDDSINYIILSEYSKNTNEYEVKDLEDKKIYTNLSVSANTETNTETTRGILYKYINTPTNAPLNWISNHPNINYSVSEITKNNKLKCVSRITLKYNIKNGETNELIELPFYIKLNDDDEPIQYNNSSKLENCNTSNFNNQNNDKYYVYECILNVSEADVEKQYFDYEIIKNSISDTTYNSSNEIEKSLDSFTYLNKYIIAKNVINGDGNYDIEVVSNGDVDDSLVLSYNMFLIDRDVPILLENIDNEKINLIYKNDSTIEYHVIMNDGICYDNLNISSNGNYELLCNSTNSSYNEFNYNTYKYNIIYNDDTPYTCYKLSNNTENCYLTNCFSDINYKKYEKNENELIAFGIIKEFYNNLNINKTQQNIISLSKRIGTDIYIASTSNEYIFQPNVYKYTYLKWVSNIKDGSKYIKRNLPYYFSKGYIYDMEDEFNNKIQYDVTNIQYTISGTPYYTFSYIDENNIVNDAIFTGNIKNNKLYSSENIKQSNLFIVYGDKNNLAMLNNTFNNVNSFIINASECNIQNTNFSNLTNVKNDSSTLNIIDSIFSNIGNKILNQTNYSSCIIKTSLEEEFTKTAQNKPLFALNNLRVYDNYCEEILSYDIYNVSNTFNYENIPECVITPTAKSFSIQRTVGNSGKSSSNYSRNTGEICFSITIPESIDADTIGGINATKSFCYELINNKYIDLGYLVGWLYYYYSSANNSALNESNRPDMHLKFAPTVTATGAIVYNSGRFGMDKIVWWNCPDEVNYSYAAIAHCAINIDNATLSNDAKILYNDGKKYLITAQSIEINVKLTANSYYAGADNDNRTYGTNAHIGNIAYYGTTPPSGINLGFFGVDIYRDSISNYTGVYNDSGEWVRSVFVATNFENIKIQKYEFDSGSQNSLIAICNNGIVIKNSASNFITHSITLSGTNIYSSSILHAGNTVTSSSVNNGVKSVQ